jgi:hypothetical protein
MKQRNKRIGTGEETPRRIHEVQQQAGFEGVAADVEGCTPLLAGDPGSRGQNQRG